MALYVKEYQTNSNDTNIWIARATIWIYHSRILPNNIMSSYNSHTNKHKVNGFISICQKMIAYLIFTQLSDIETHSIQSLLLWIHNNAN